jgi:hypothetical protein
MGDNLFWIGVIGILCVSYALKLGWDTVKAWKQYRKSKDWIPITGLVTATYLDETQTDDGVTYQPVIKYTYQVMGENYEGSLISFGYKAASYVNMKKAEKAAARRPLGSQPTVYYDPNDPSQAVLERKFTPSSAFLGLVVGLVGIGMIYSAYFQ